MNIPGREPQLIKAHPGYEFVVSGYAHLQGNKSIIHMYVSEAKRTVFSVAWSPADPRELSLGPSNMAISD